MTNEDKRACAVDIVQRRAEAFDAAGLTLENLLGRLVEELNAEDTEFAKYLGKICDSRKVPAWTVRQAARRDAHALRGDYPTKDVNMVATININEDFTEEERKRAKEFAVQRAKDALNEIAKKDHQ